MAWTPAQPPHFRGWLRSWRHLEELEQQARGGRKMFAIARRKSRQADGEPVISQATDLVQPGFAGGGDLQAGASPVLCVIGSGDPTGGFQALDVAAHGRAGNLFGVGEIADPDAGVA